MSFLAVGDPLKTSIKLPRNQRNIKFLISTPEYEFSNNVKQVLNLKDRLPVLLYSSRYDLAPFLILELGLARVPVCVQRNTDSYQILKNFLPEGAFFPFNELSEVIDAGYSGRLEICSGKLEEFTNLQGQGRFDEKIKFVIRRWINE